MKLGKTQQHVLDALKRHSGCWYAGSGWIWSTMSETTRIMDSLVRRGLVTVEDETLPASKFMPERTLRVYKLKEST